MTPTLTLLDSQKLRGVLFVIAGTFLFTLLLAHSGMLGHLEAILGLSVGTVTSIVNAILTGTIFSLPGVLQGIALTFSSLVVNLVGSLGVSGVIAL
jgi:hypothetical protein